VAEFPIARPGRLLVRLVLILALGVTLIGVLLGSWQASVIPAGEARNDSAAMVSGNPADPSVHFRVTVDQTRNLIRSTLPSGAGR
jgi:hypothetical protein